MKEVRGDATPDNATPGSGASDAAPTGSASPEGPTHDSSSPDSPLRPERAKLLPPLLAAIIKAAPGMALAFSGGLDSRFLAHAACLLLPAPEWPTLFHVRGPHVPPGESLEAEAWAKARGLKLKLVDFDPLSLDKVRANGRDRCYHCKLGMFRAIGLAAGVPDKPEAAHNDAPGRPGARNKGRPEAVIRPAAPDRPGMTARLHDGSNASDSKSFRPGLAALQELGVRSPLAEAGLDKAEIMRVAALSGLERPRQRARPCLLTRFAYDLAPERQALEALAEAEKTLEALLGEWGDADGAPDFRLRLVAGKMTGGDRSGEGGMRNEDRSSLPGRAGDGGQSGGPPLAAWSAELHVAAPLPTAARKVLAGALQAAGCGSAPLICLESVSGHFDHYLKAF